MQDGAGKGKVVERQKVGRMITGHHKPLPFSPMRKVQNERSRLSLLELLAIHVLVLILLTIHTLPVGFCNVLDNELAYIWPCFSRDLRSNPPKGNLAELVELVSDCRDIRLPRTRSHPCQWHVRIVLHVETQSVACTYISEGF